MLFRSATLDDLYPEFHTDLLSGKINRIREKLKINPGLATYDKPGSMPPVISAIHHSFSHQKAPEVLDVLAEYKANFNVTCHVKTHFKREINCDINPIAWLLLQGGDSRLVKKLSDCGTNKNHPSINKIKQIIADHKSEQEFDYSSPYNGNPNDRSPSQLISKL